MAKVWKSLLVDLVPSIGFFTQTFNYPITRTKTEDLIDDYEYDYGDSEIKGSEVVSPPFPPKQEAPKFDLDFLHDLRPDLFRHSIQSVVYSPGEFLLSRDGIHKML